MREILKMGKNQGLEFRGMLKVYIGGSMRKAVEREREDWRTNMVIFLMVCSRRVF